MTDRKRKTATERRSHKKAMIALHETRLEWRDFVARRDMIPKEWHRMHEIATTVPEKERITIRLDKDTVKWFRSQGRGWHNRMDAVLTAYRHMVIAKIIEWPDARDWDADMI